VGIPGSYTANDRQIGCSSNGRQWEDKALRIPQPRCFCARLSQCTMVITLHRCDHCCALTQTCTETPRWWSSDVNMLTSGEVASTATIFLSSLWLPLLVPLEQHGCHMTCINWNEHSHCKKQVSFSLKRV